MIPFHRYMSSIRDTARGVNRPEGTGGGSGLYLISPGGAAGGNQGAYATANSSTWVDITNTSFTFVINRPQFIEYRIYAAAHLSAAGALGYIRGNIVGFATSAGLEFGPTATTNGLMWYQPLSAGAGLIQRGIYTAKLQAATDNAGFSVTVDQFFHQIIPLS